jgi:hypothetical protein
MNCDTTNLLINFKPLPGVEYKNPYWLWLQDPGVKEHCELYLNEPEKYTWENNKYLNLLRICFLDDIFFQLHFIHCSPDDAPFNHEFVVKMCREIEQDEVLHQEGECHDYEDLWARGHVKSTSMTIAQNLKRRMNNPNSCSIIFSHTKKMAEEFLSSIKLTLEKPIMYKMFSDIIWKNFNDAPSWSIRDGLTLKRQNMSRKEKSFQTSGLVEGMATGGHYDDLFYDDVETDDLADNPQMLFKLIKKFDISRNMRMATGTKSLVRVIGTPYHHQGLLMHIKDLKDINEKLIYRFRIVPAVDDDDNPVFLSQKELDILKTSDNYNSQQLCDPTPEKGAAFRSSHLQEVLAVPKKLVKFMVIDPAGDNKGKADGDAWSIMCLGAEPEIDELGASNIYILDLVLKPMEEVEAVKQIVNMYTRNGIIQSIGIEQINSGLLRLHVSHILKEQHNIELSEDEGTLIPLKAQSRKAGGGKNRKKEWIRTALSWPFRNGKIHILRSIPYVYRQRFKDEMDKFPMWHDDGLDALSWYPVMLEEIDFDYYTEQDDSKIINLLSHRNTEYPKKTWMSL